jgi:single-strand DNA-binding protein
MYNKLITIGHLTRDIELKYLQNGSVVANGAIATSHKYKTQTGEQKDEVCFLDFAVFGKQGEILNQYVRKGSKVMLEGRLIFQQWKAADGTNRSKHSLVVSEFKFLDTKADSMNKNNQAPEYDGDTRDFNNGSSVYPPANGGQQIPNNTVAPQQQQQPYNNTNNNYGQQAMPNNNQNSNYGMGQQQAMPNNQISNPPQQESSYNGNAGYQQQQIHQQHSGMVQQQEKAIPTIDIDNDEIPF